MAEQDTRQRTTQSSGDGQATSCYKVAQNLPVYLNGRLADDEAQALEAHLTTCSACRREERETRTAWDLYEGHLPVDLLLDFAMAQPMPSRQRAVIESHLAQCERCSEEVATVRQEPANTGSITAAAPTSAQGQAGARTREPTSRHWRQLAWAASFVAIIAGIGWLRTWQQLADTRTLTTTVTARTNLPVVELLPATQPLLRQGRKPPPAAANPVALHEDAEELVLVLLAGGNDCAAGCVLEVYEPGEAEPLRRLEGLVPRSDGHLTLAVPSDWLPPGSSVVVISNAASGDSVAEYSIEAGSSE